MEKIYWSRDKLIVAPPLVIAYSTIKCSRKCMHYSWHTLVACVCISEKKNSCDVDHNTFSSRVDMQWCFPWHNFFLCTYNKTKSQHKLHSLFLSLFVLIGTYGCSSMLLHLWRTRIALRLQPGSLRRLPSGVGAPTTLHALL
jgi:hypothetical protein